MARDGGQERFHQSPINNQQRLIDSDPYLRPYEKILRRRQKRIRETEETLTGGKISLPEFASGHEYFGLHFKDNQWIFREWAPNATSVYLIGDMSGWQERKRFALEHISGNPTIFSPRKHPCLFTKPTLVLRRKSKR
jgi:hypothetical protein